MEPPAEQIGTTGETVSITGNAEIDAVLVQFTDSAALESALAYVYLNLRPAPKFNTAKDSRKVYATQGTPVNRTYYLRDTDIAWLARSLGGEGYTPETLAQAHAWTMFYRFMLHPNYVQGSSFWGMITDFSQPVDPKWKADGWKCKGKNTGNCSPASMERRIRATYGKIPTKALEYAEQFAIGTLAVPDQVFVNFASYPEALANKNAKILYNTRNMPTAFFTAPKDSYTLWRNLYAQKMFRKPKYTTLTSAEQEWVEDVLNKMTVVPTTTLTQDKFKNNIPIDLPRMLKHITASLASGQRVDGEKKSRAEIATLASSIYQGMANKKGQQVANAAATVNAAQASASTSPSKIATGKGGHQVGSDDTWNFE